MYGHYATECRKPRREKDKNEEKTPEENLTKFEDDESTLLLSECKKVVGDVVFLNEEKVVPSFDQKNSVTADKNLWYLDSGASNQMIGHYENFNELNEYVSRQVHLEMDPWLRLKARGR